MKKLCSLLLLLNLSMIFGQNADPKQFTIHIESGEGAALKSCEGIFFSPQLTKNKTHYSAILASRKVIENTGKITLHFKPEANDGVSLLKLTVPVKLTETIYDNSTDLVIIPFYLITRFMEDKKPMHEQVLLTYDALAEIFPEINQKHLNKLKDSWEWEVNEAMKKRL